MSGRHLTALSSPPAPPHHTNGSIPLELLELVAERAFCAQGASDFQFLICQEDHSKLSSKTIQCGN